MVCPPPTPPVRRILYSGWDTGRVAAKIFVFVISLKFSFRVLRNFPRITRNRNFEEILAISQNTKSKFGQHFCYFEKNDLFLFKNINKLFILGHIDIVILFIISTFYMDFDNSFGTKKVLFSWFSKGSLVKTNNF